MADSPLRRALTGFPAVQEPRDTFRSLQQTVINIRERLRQIEAQVNLDIGSGSSITGNPFPEAPADGNIYGRRNRAWTIVKLNGLRFTFDSEPPDLATGNEGDEWFESDSGILYTLVDDGSNRQWVELTTPGEGAPGSDYVRVDVYDVPGSYTWLKPAGAALVEVVLVGGGGGGGGGMQFPAYRANGGGGGGGAAALQFVGLADAFSASETVVVGAGGSGGAGVSAILANPGTAGGNSSFAGRFAYGGGGGSRGQNSAAPGGGGAGAASPGNSGTPTGAGYGGDFGGSTGDNSNPIGGAGGAGQTGSGGAGFDGFRAVNGGQGGANGGGGVEYGVIMAGGDAYEWNLFATPTVLGGTTTVDKHGQTAAGMAKSLRGAGGGGGAGLGPTAGVWSGDGGDGKQPGGGGGGGGGAGGNSPRGGDGGEGGAGIAIVITYLSV